MKQVRRLSKHHPRPLVEDMIFCLPLKKTTGGSVAFKPSNFQNTPTRSQPVCLKFQKNKYQPIKTRIFASFVVSPSPVQSGNRFLQKKNGMDPKNIVLKRPNLSRHKSPQNKQHQLRPCKIGFLSKKEMKLVFQPSIFVAVNSLFGEGENVALFSFKTLKGSSTLGG